MVQETNKNPLYVWIFNSDMNSHEQSGNIIKYILYDYTKYIDNTKMIIASYYKFTIPNISKDAGVIADINEFDFDRVLFANNFIFIVSKNNHDNKTIYDLFKQKFESNIKELASEYKRIDSALNGARLVLDRLLMNGKFIEVNEENI